MKISVVITELEKAVEILDKIYGEYDKATDGKDETMYLKEAFESASEALGKFEELQEEESE